MPPENQTLDDALLELVGASACAGDLRSITLYFQLHRWLTHNPKPALRWLPGILLNKYFPTRQDVDQGRLAALSIYDGHTWSQLADALRKHVYDHPRFVACINRIVSVANDYPRTSPAVAHTTR